MTNETIEHTSGMTRRSFNKWTAAVGGTTALVASGVTLLPLSVAPSAAHGAEGIPDAKTTWSACVVNCGSRCPLRLQVQDGHIVRVLPDNTGMTPCWGARSAPACVDATCVSASTTRTASRCH